MWIALCYVVTALVLYCSALSHAMGAKRWGVLGLCFGPFIVPLFFIHKRLQWLKAQGAANVSVLVR